MGQIVRKVHGSFEDSWVEKFWIVGNEGEVREWTVELESKRWGVEQWMFKSGDDELRFASVDWSYNGAVREVEKRA